MKKSVSSPNLPLLPQQQSLRRVSTSAISLNAYTSPPLLSPEIEYVVTKVPIQKIVSCYAPSVVVEQDMEDLGSCLSEPVEVESDPNTRSRYAWLERTISDKDLRVRYQAIFERLRRKKK
jgi:hypothetical protein